MRYLSTIVTLPFALAVILFCVSNRDAVTVDFWPLPLSYDVPLYMVGLGTLLLGLLFGGFSTWVAARKGRAAARKKDRELRRARRQNAELRDRLAEADFQRRTAKKGETARRQQADETRPRIGAGAA